jgi:hypothetical protein
MSLSRAAVTFHLRQLPRSSAISPAFRHVPRPSLIAKPLRQYNFSILARARPNPSRPTIFQAFRPFRPRFNSSRPSPDPTPNLGSPPQSLTLSQRLKALSKEYGWTAVGVYLALSVLDFPFCFLAVRVLGTERIGRWEHAIIDKFWEIVSIPFPTLGARKQPVEGGLDEDTEAVAVTHHASGGEEEAASKIYKLLE